MDTDVVAILGYRGGSFGRVDTDVVAILGYRGGPWRELHGFGDY